LKLATYETGETFNQSASLGFIELWGLQSRIAYAVSQNAINAKHQKAEKIVLKSI
jgi:argininosuccinate synthase